MYVSILYGVGAKLCATLCQADCWAPAGGSVPGETWFGISVYDCPNDECVKIARSPEASLENSQSIATWCLWGFVVLTVVILGGLGYACIYHRPEQVDLCPTILPDILEHSYCSSVLSLEPAALMSCVGLNDIVCNIRILSTTFPSVAMKRKAMITRPRRRQRTTGWTQR